jgi:3-phenylpropionate/trans-cinnamate dioxygenase ferredoxin reductase component
MPHYKYLIVGGGMTADAAVGGIREIDPEGSIGVISSDHDAPYNRPPLTKALWKGEPLESVWRNTESKKADLLLGRTADIISVEPKTITDNQKSVYTYKRLLLATGGTPGRLPFGGEHIIYFRTLADYRRLRALTEKGRKFAVIGGGFIGSELAAALRINRREVLMIFPGSGICDRVFPADLSHFLNDFYREKGIELWTGESLSGVDRQGEQFLLTTESKRQAVVDGVIAGIGITPSVELARMAGLEVENGIVVDEFLRTTKPDIYAAGDVAAFYDPALEKRIRVEHEDNANMMGRSAGRNMAGAAERYRHLPFFYSDLFELGYEAVGELNASLTVSADWKELYREGVIYYQKDERVRGVLLWNVWGQVDAARELIASKRPLASKDSKSGLAWRTK